MKRMLFFVLFCGVVSPCFGQSNDLAAGYKSIREFEEPVQLALIDQLHEHHRTKTWTDTTGQHRRTARYSSCDFKLNANGETTTEIDSVELYLVDDQKYKSIPFYRLSENCQRRTKKILHFERMIGEQGALNRLIKNVYKLEDRKPNSVSRMHEVRCLRKQNIRLTLTGGGSQSGRLRSVSPNALKFGGGRSGGFVLG